MRWFKVVWSYDRFREQKFVELVFGSSDRIREHIAALKKTQPNEIIIHEYFEYEEGGTA